jgi:hypothetical protein
MTKILFVSCRQRHPAANRLELPRSTKHANPCSKSSRWADIEQGRRGAASTMRGQDAKWSLLILYAFAGFLAGKLSKVSATSLYWIDPTTRALSDARQRRRSMTTSTSGGSAQIYQFPPRGRFALNACDESQAVESQPLVKVAAGSGWYHDAAIQEAERPRSN